MPCDKIYFFMWLYFCLFLVYIFVIPTCMLMSCHTFTLKNSVPFVIFGKCRYLYLFLKTYLAFYVIFNMMSNSLFVFSIGPAQVFVLYDEYN